MARLITVDDSGDARLADYVSLRDVQLRKHLESEHGFFIAHLGGGKAAFVALPNHRDVDAQMSYLNEWL